MSRVLTSAIKRGTDAFTHLQASEHDPEVMIIRSSGYSCLMHASLPHSLHQSSGSMSVRSTSLNCSGRHLVLGIGYWSHIPVARTHSPTLFFSAPYVDRVLSC